MSARSYAGTAASAPADARTTFIRQTYLHLAGAVLAFIAVETVLVQLPFADDLSRVMTDGYAWLAVLGLFFFVSSVADRWARSNTSVGMQYLGLALFVVAQAVVMLPILYGAVNYSSDDVIPAAAILTGLLFLGLTIVAFTSGADFSFLRSAITIGSLLSIGLIVASIVFGFSLGLLFAAGLVVLASASILYQTGNIIRTYRTNRHVAAALGLFSSVALLFWNVLRLVQRR